MAIDLVPLCTARLTLERPLRIPETPTGTYFAIGIKEGRWEGERLKGNLVGPAGDWFLAGAGGRGTLDVRGQIETDDGARILVHYRGRQDISEGTGSPLYVAPMFETGDERYSWLNTILAVGKGALEGPTLTYDMFEVR